MNLKRIIPVLMVLIVLSTVVCFETSAASDKMPDLLIGDADGDGVVSIMDSTAIAFHLAKKVPLDEIHQQTAKTDFTTEVLSVIDATIIQQKVADIDNKDTREVGYPAFLYVNGEYVPAQTEYQRFLEKLMGIYGLSGVAYASRNGRVMCQSALGMQNTEKNIEMSVDSLFAIGSVSKQFCATAVLMLQDEGKLSVNDTIDKYFPEYKYGSQITIHELLCMRSGILDYANDGDFMHDIFIHDNREDNLNALLNWTLAQDLKSEPDTKWEYSNTNYFLLSLIVEQVSEMSYYDFMKAQIFEPLSMNNTGFYDEMVFDERLAEMVMYDGIDIFAPVGFGQGDGDIVSNAHDMDLWLTAMSDGVLLSEESFKMMTTNYSGVHNYGYGINVDKHEKYSHSGHIPTYVTSVITYGRENINVFVVSNDAIKATIEEIDIKMMAQQLANKIR